MEENKKQTQETKSKSWADLFDEFVSNPPTSSIFRLYLLSFIIWNKKLLLYIFFDGNTMIDKLNNWESLVPFYKSCKYALLWNGSSLYAGPLIVFALIYLLTFGLFKWKGFYRPLNTLHKDLMIESLSKDYDIEKARETVYRKREENIKLEYGLKESVPYWIEESWLNDYLSFKKISFLFPEFDRFKQVAFHEYLNKFNINDGQINFNSRLTGYLKKVGVIESKEDGSSSFNKKGEAFVWLSDNGY